MIGINYYFFSNSQIVHQPIAVIKQESTNIDKESTCLSKKAVEGETSAAAAPLNNCIMQTQSNSFKATDIKITTQPKVVSVLPEITHSEVQERIALKIKIERSPCKSQNKIDTDRCSSSDEIEAKPPKKKKKKSKLKRKSSSSVQMCSDDEIEITKAAETHQKTEKCPMKQPSQTSTNDSEAVAELNESQQPLVEEEVKKVSELKNLINKLSHGETADAKNLLDTFESLVGKEGFDKLKSLFVKNQESSEKSCSEEVKAVEKAVEDSKSREKTPEKVEKLENPEKMLQSEKKVLGNLLEESSNDESDVPLKTLLLRSKAANKTKQTKKKRSEVDRLNEDINEMFIRDGVLKAQGLRDHKKKLYADDDLFQDELYDTECSDFTESSVTTEECSSSESSERSFESDVPFTMPLSECRVLAEKLDLEGVEMPVTIMENGKIFFLPKTKENLQEDSGDDAPQTTQIDLISDDELTAEDTSKQDLPAEDPAVKPEEEKPPSPVLPPNLEDVEIITIEDDDDEPVILKAALSPPVLTNNLNSKVSRIIMETLSSPPSQLITKNEKTVYNLSFYKCRVGITLKCNTEKCSYETLHEQMFTYHIQTRHLLTKWSGSCKLCNLSVSNFGSLIDEYNHMNQVHILGDSDPKDIKKYENTKVANVKRKIDQLEQPSPKRKAIHAPRKTVKYLQQKETEVKMNSVKDVMIQPQEAPALPVALVAPTKIAFAVPAAYFAPAKSTLAAAQASPASLETARFNFKATPAPQENAPALPATTVPAPATTSTILLETARANFRAARIQSETPPLEKTSAPMGIKFRNLPGDKLSSVKKQLILSLPSPSNVFSANTSSTSLSSASVSPIPNQTNVALNHQLSAPNGNIRPLLISKISQGVGVNIPSRFQIVQRPVQNINKIIPVGNRQSPISILPINHQALNSTPEAVVTSPNLRESPAVIATPNTKLQPQYNNDLLINLIRRTPLKKTRIDSKRLRPWLGMVDSKAFMNCIHMLEKDCLVDLFKCMGSMCSFHSDSAEVFLNHLEMHERLIPKDVVNYGRCAYCNFSTKAIGMLITHIDIIHKNDKYSCTRCFYRSVVRNSVVYHQSIYHKDPTKAFHECPVDKTLNYRAAVDEVKSIRARFIHPISCASKLI